MSKKRAYVDATITACAASDIFTQDLEDLDPEEKKTKAPQQEQAKKESGNPPENQYMALRWKELREKIIAIMTERDPDGCDYFLDHEKLSARKILTRAGPFKEGVDILEDLFHRNDKELQERKAAYKPIPFGEDLPAMYTEPESEDGGKQQDIF
jgi:hypothetical protein